MAKLDYMAVSVFVDPTSDAGESGNLLAVFPEGEDFTVEQMQQIAHDLRPPGGHQENFSETVFITGSRDDSYSVRIFTPREELPFAGHPTLGSAWLLRHLGELKATEVKQHSPAGITDVRLSDDVVWFHRTGEAGRDLRVHHFEIDLKVAKALGLEREAIGLEPRELGRSVARLNPAVVDAGIPHLLVPLRDVSALGQCRPVAQLLADLPPGKGAYCFTATRAGHLQARGFFPALGIEEDPATGSAAASLGMYLADRVGPIEFEIDQGIELGRPSKLCVSSRRAEVDVGGRCELILEASLSSVP